MTIKECIDLVDNAKPNQYTTREKVMWLSFLDGTIINDVLKTHEGYDGRYDLFEGYSEDKLTTELIVPSPYDRLYPQYLKMKIDGENGEIVRYNNSAALYNTYLSEFKKWYNKTHMPISGAVMGGAKNDIGSCGCQSNADIADKAAISAEEARQSAVRASDKAEEARVSAVRAESAKDGADRARAAASAVVSAVAAMRNEVEEDASEVRGLAEGFSEAEAKRVTAEGLRVKAESMRVSAENARVSAENAREKEMRELAQRVEEALEGGSSAGGGFRKIGFTEDCDFIATAEDGLTAFKDALEAASDGETILVMPGVYKGTERFDVTKNIAFVGIGKPEINFPIWISGGGVFSYENWAWETVYDSITSKWDGFRFSGEFTVGMEANPDNDGYAGKGVFIDCDFVGYSVQICGSAKNCTFDVVAFTSGHYYGEENCCTEFDGCTIKASGSFDASSGYDKYRRCDIYPVNGSTAITDYGNKVLVGCRMYAPGVALGLTDSHSGTAVLNDTIVFANSVSGASGGYLVKPTAN